MLCAFLTDATKYGRSVHMSLRHTPDVGLLIMRLRVALLRKETPVKNTILNSIIEPLAFRVGSMISGALVAQGLAQEHGPSVATSVTVVILLGCELAARKVLRK